MIRARRNLSMPKRSNAFAKFRHCGCLSCQIITLVLDQQAESHGTKWRPSEVMHALSEASALFCNELIAHFGDAAFAESGGPAEHLHALVLGKIGTLQHGPASTESRVQERATVH